MADFASDEWIEERAGRLATVEADPGPSLTVEQRIDDVAVWSITVAEGRVTMTAGPATDPDVRLLADATTAAAIHRGDLSAQRAFLDGQLRIGGDITTLFAHRRALALINTAMAAEGGPADGSGPT